MHETGSSTAHRVRLRPGSTGSRGGSRGAVLVLCAVLVGGAVLAGCATAPTAESPGPGRGWSTTTPSDPTVSGPTVVPAGVTASSTAAEPVRATTARSTSAPLTTATVLDTPPATVPRTTVPPPTPPTVLVATPPTTAAPGPAAPAPSAAGSAGPSLPPAAAPATQDPTPATPDPAPAPAAPSAGRPAPPRSATGTVNGCNAYGANCDGNPLYADVPAPGYDYRTQPKNGAVDNGVQLTASCWTTGGTTTNFAATDPYGDRYSSDVYYLAATSEGVVGYIPDTYFVRDPTGLGLPACS